MPPDPKETLSARLRAMAVQRGYGFFPGGDPRRFTPDEDSPEAAKMAHSDACLAAETAGAVSLSGACSVDADADVVTTAVMFGLGVYVYEDEEIVALAQEAEQLETELAKLRAAAAGIV